jgi:hypothetical protein
MNPVRRTVCPTALLVALPLFLMLAPCASAVANAQTASEASKADTDEEADDEGNVPPRGGLGWTGISLMSAGGMLLAGSFTFNDSKGCGFFNELACRDVGRVYGTTGVAMVATGLTFLIMDEVRRHPTKRQTAIAIGPRAIQVSMRW